MSISDSENSYVNSKSLDIASLDCDMSNTSEDDSPWTPEYLDEEDANLMTDVFNHDFTTKLANSGLIGRAAVAAIVSTKTRTPFAFEICPIIRNRQKNRLIRKLQNILKQYSTIIGQQAVVLIATPTDTSYKVFGAQPLQNIVRNLKNEVMGELEHALNKQTPPDLDIDGSLFKLPPLVIDGIPTPVEKMTQKQLRSFIPFMLKYSTGRSTPGWSKETLKPVWWPKDVPWSNIRMDPRTSEEKQQISWTSTLRKVVINCYKYHGREDLLLEFTDNTLNKTTNAFLTNGINLNNIQFIQVDENNQMITLSDGIKAGVFGVTTITSEFNVDSNENINFIYSKKCEEFNGFIIENIEIENKGVVLKGSKINDGGYLSFTFEKGSFKEIDGVITIPVSFYQSIANTYK